jgi:hypothetical protein
VEKQLQGTIPMLEKATDIMKIKCPNMRHVSKWNHEITEPFDGEEVVELEDEEEDKYALQKDSEFDLPENIEMEKRDVSEEMIEIKCIFEE